jgi:hypothetical protein
MDRTFTLDEANGLLPLLEALLRSAMNSNERLHQLHEELQEIRQRVFLSGGSLLDMSRLLALRREGDENVQQVRDKVAEIDAMGVQVKDLEMGLLDFPCRVDDETILLCWKAGEPAISYWHGLEEGFKGRKPINPRITRSKSRPN